jgi:hypothetical protein
MAKTKRPRVKPDDKEQSKLFIQKAREIEADESRSAADKLLGHLHSKPPEPRGKKASR